MSSIEDCFIPSEVGTAIQPPPVPLKRRGEWDRHLSPPVTLGNHFWGNVMGISWGFGEFHGMSWEFHGKSSWKKGD